MLLRILTLAAGIPAAASASADPGPRLLGDRLRDDWLEGARTHVQC